MRCLFSAGRLLELDQSTAAGALGNNVLSYASEAEMYLPLSRSNTACYAGAEGRERRSHDGAICCCFGALVPAI